jgi:hypothetical protein
MFGWLGGRFAVAGLRKFAYSGGFAQTSTGKLLTIRRLAIRGPLTCSSCPGVSLMLRLARFFLPLLLVLSCAFAWAEDKLPAPAAPAEPEGMKALFNGKDLEGWDGDPRLWSVKDGVIRGETTSEAKADGNTFLVWKGGTLEDFELRIKFKIDHGNSGIQFRSELLPPNENAQNKWVVKGYQAEVENTPGKVGFLYHERGRGYLCNVGEQVAMGEDGKPKVVGKLGEKDEIAKLYNNSDWNEYVIICKGNHVRHFLNGVQTVDMTDNDPKGRHMSGILALQIHAGPPMWVEFKDIRLKQLPKE